MFTYITSIQAARWCYYNYSYYWAPPPLPWILLQLQAQTKKKQQQKKNKSNYTKQTNKKFSNKTCSSLQTHKFCTDTKFSHKICSLQNCKFLTLWPTFLHDIPLVIFSTHITQSQAGVLKFSDFQLELLRLVFFHNFNHFYNFWPNICALQIHKKILLKFKRDPSNSSLVPKEVNKVQLLHEFWYELPNQSNHIYLLWQWCCMPDDNMEPPSLRNPRPDESTHLHILHIP